MSSGAQLAAVSAELNSGTYSPSTLKFTMDVDTFPSATAAISSKGDELQVPLAAETIDRIAEMQKKRLAGRTDPDFRAEAEDGIGGSMTYQGYIAAPLLSLSKVSTLDRVSSVGRVALIDALNLSIYSARYSLEREEAGSDMEPIKAAPSGDITATLSEITKVLVRNYSKVLEKETMPVSQEILRLQHEINTSGAMSPLSLWLAILQGGSVKYDSWDLAFKEIPTLPLNLSERLRTFLETPNPGFWGHIQNLASSFKMFYVPDFNGPGKFVRADRKVEEPEITLKLSVTNLDLADGSTRVLQPGGVVMMMSGSVGEREEAQPDPTIPRVAAYAPDPILPGFIHREDPPFWLFREGGVPIFGSEVDVAPPVVGSPSPKSLDLAKRKAARSAGKAYQAKVDTVSSGILTELCEVTFKSMQLEQSTVSIGTPLDFGLNKHIGKRAVIEVRRNSLFWAGRRFTAFVSGLTHSLSLDQGKQVSATTELRLSHVDYSEP